MLNMKRRVKIQRIEIFCDEPDEDSWLNAVKDLTVLDIYSKNHHELKLS